MATSSFSSAAADPVRAVTTGHKDLVTPITMLSLLLGAIVWCYWNVLSEAAVHWQQAKYSHGYLVPVFTFILLYLRRDPDAAGVQVSRVGIGLLVMAGFCLGGVPNMPGMLAWFDPTSADLAAGNFTAGAGSTAEHIVDYAALAGVILAIAGGLLIIQQPTEYVSDQERWIGAGILLGALALRLAFTHLFLKTFEMYSFVPAVVGIFVVVGGLRFLKWAGTALVCLIFMFPLPGPVDLRLLTPMQKYATIASTYCLETMGLPASQDGNVIYLGDKVKPLEVAEKCSGLRMLTMFIFLSYAFALLIDRPNWERLVLFASSIPIAIGVNIIRIVVTGLLYYLAGHYSSFLDQESVTKLGHDMAGLFMMPVALGILAIEYQILIHVFVQEDTGPVQMVSGRKSPPRMV